MHLGAPFISLLQKNIMTQSFRPGIVSCLIVFLTACTHSALRVDSHLAPDLDLSHLRGWNWAPRNGELKTPAAITTAERIQLESLVNAEVNSRLAQKGYSHVRDKPDFWIAWSFGEWALNRKHRPGDGYGAAGLMYPGLHGSNLPESPDGRALPPSLDPYSSRYEEAKLEIVIVDPDSSRVLWDATITDDSDFGYFKPSQQYRIREAVQALLEGLPPNHLAP